MNRQFLAAKTAFVFTIALMIAPVAPKKAEAGIPVIDVAGLVQAIFSVLESITQTANMISQYTTQLRQFENQLKNTVNAPQFIWDQARSTIDNLISTVDTLDYYKTRLGSIDSFLGKFGDLDYYKNSPCFTSVGCSPAARQQLLAVRALASESQKKANDALFKGLEDQQEGLKSDARQLERLQGKAQTADGQMQAIQYANQLASNQANQLMQIRALLIAQQNASTSMLQADVDKKAQQDAADEALRTSTYKPSPERKW